MQDGWERRTPFLHLTADELTGRLQRAIPGVRVRSAVPLTNGLRNSTYRAVLLGLDLPVAIRVYTADAGACQREVALTGLVRGDVPVPSCLGSDAHASPPVAVFQWMGGQPFDRWLVSAAPGDIWAASHSAGALLAAIHDHRFTEAGFLGPDLTISERFETGGDGWARYIEMFLFRRGIAAQLGAPLAERLWGLTQASASRLDVLKDDRFLVHADYKPQNLLVAKRGNDCVISGVLDWEFAFSGPPLLDVGLYLRSERVRHPAYREGFVAGYWGAGGELPPDWRALALLLDLLNLCSLLDNLGDSDNVVRDVRVLVEETMDAIESA